MWVITRAINDYNQDGDYLERVFKDKPTVEQLNEMGYNGEYLYKGGGREEGDYVWYYLTKIKEGELYK